MAFLSYLQPARDFFLKQHDPAQAEAALRPLLDKPETQEEKRAVYELMGLILRAQKRFEEAYQIYVSLGDPYQAGYCAFLMADLPRMQQHWTQLLTERPNHWCLSLYGMAMHQLRSYPTLFQIRNHLESDIANLIHAGRLDYLENLILHTEFLTQLNLETPKFVGRALMHAGWLERAGEFLLSGQKALPTDPEIYFHLGQYSVALNHEKEARLMLKQCLMISPTYRPARELLETLPSVF